RHHPTSPKSSQTSTAYVRTSLIKVGSYPSTLPLAAASWWLIEKPSMALKRRLRRKWSAATTAERGHPATTAAR
ncbi:hypothetical protein BST46_12850, partial [Mycobacterium timonense]